MILYSIKNQTLVNYRIKIHALDVIIASQYKSKLKKMIVINASNSKEFVNGFDSAAWATNFDLTAKDKQILKHFKVWQ